jgi:hypothetical protein
VVCVSGGERSAEDRTRAAVAGPSRYLENHAEAVVGRRHECGRGAGGSRPRAVTDPLAADGSEDPTVKQTRSTEKHRIFTTSFASVYPHYVAKAEKKGRTKKELDQVICWLTGYSERQLAQVIQQKTDFETFFSEAPALNPNATLITGVVCGVRIEDIENPLMRKIRYLDKLVDELAKGRPMEKILRT